jgi:hypothetical protein
MSILNIQELIAEAIEEYKKNPDVKHLVVLNL